MIGSALAGLAVAAGLDVVVSNSRGPETLTDLVARLGDSARAAIPEEAELYFGHADHDATNPADQIDRLDKALTAAGVRHQGETYTGALHGFTQADTAMYNAEATARHWAALLDLFGRRL
jgi:dienelactone hydrolase